MSPIAALCFMLGSIATAAAASAQAEVSRLVAAYPQFLDRIEGNDLVWKDGTRMAIDDGLGVKTHEAWLAKPDLKDMLLQPYKAGRAFDIPKRNEDPGRARNAAFFDKMYGDCRAGEVAKGLVDVVWLPKKWGKPLKVTAVNGVADRLRAVSAELDALPSAFDPFLTPPAGTYNCRVIAGTSRVSAHGHGIAVDIAAGKADYWQWHAPKGAKANSGVSPYRNNIPLEIVEIFERHGFIWGGKWYHYDSMHFEYRPELLAAGGR